MSLGTRVILLVWLASGLLLAGMLYTQHQLLFSNHEAGVTERQEAGINRLATDLERALDRRLMALDSLAWRLLDGDQLRPDGQIKSFLQQPTIARDLFSDGLLVFDANGTAIAETQHVPGRIGTSYADREHFQRLFATDEAVISEPILGRTTNVPLISFLVPILNREGQRLAIIGGIVDLSSTALLPEQQQDEGKGVVSFVLDPTNRLFVSMDQRMTTPKPLPPSGKHSLIDAAIEQMPTGSVVSHDGREYIIAATQLEHLDWIVLRAIDYEQAIGPANHTFAIFAGTGALIMILLGAASWFAARTLTRPLDDMTRRIDRMADDASGFQPLRVKGSPEVRALARAMNRLARERQAVDHLKDDFISSVSHELRTPLTSLHGGLKLAHSGVTGQLPERARQIVGLALRNSERLSALVNDILDFNRLASGKITLSLESCSVKDIVTEALADMAPMADAKKLRFITRFSGNPTALADGQRMRQVIDNLLSNAVKHSPEEGCITVTVIAQQNGRIRTTVADQGDGVPAEFSHRIFQRFAQAEHGSKRATRGTGLGLAISRGLVVQMNGDIGFYNDRGAHFWFDLPATRMQ